MTQPLEACIDLVKKPSWDPNSWIRKLSTTCNSKSGVQSPLLDSVDTSAHTHSQRGYSVIFASSLLLLCDVPSINLPLPCGISPELGLFWFPHKNNPKTFWNLQRMHGLVMY